MCPEEARAIVPAQVRVLEDSGAAVRRQGADGLWFALCLLQEPRDAAVTALAERVGNPEPWVVRPQL